MTSCLAGRIARARRLLAIYVLVLRVKSKRCLVRAVLVVVTAVVMVATGELVGHGLVDEQAEVAAPVQQQATPAPQARHHYAVTHERSTGGLFHPEALLDTSRIDDLR